MTTKRQLAELLAHTDKRVGTHEVKVARLMEFTHGALERKLEKLTSN